MRCRPPSKKRRENFHAREKYDTVKADALYTVFNSSGTHNSIRIGMSVFECGKRTKYGETHKKADPLEAKDYKQAAIKSAAEKTSLDEVMEAVRYDLYRLKQRAGPGQLEAFRFSMCVAARFRVFYMHHSVPPSAPAGHGFLYVSTDVVGSDLAPQLKQHANELCRYILANEKMSVLSFNESHSAQDQGAWCVHLQPKSPATRIKMSRANWNALQLHCRYMKALHQKLTQYYCVEEVYVCEVAGTPVAPRIGEMNEALAEIVD